MSPWIQLTKKLNSDLDTDQVSQTHKLFRLRKQTFMIEFEK